MARNVADLAMFQHVLTGEDVNPEPGTSMKGKRIGWLGDFGGALPYQPGVLELCETALKTFELMGCTVAPATPDYSVEAAWQSFRKLRGWFNSGSRFEQYQDPALRALLKPEAIHEVEVGLALSAFELREQAQVRAEWSRAVAALFDEFDYLVVPTAQVFAFDASMTWPAEVGGQAMRTYHEWMAAQCLITLSGSPSLAVPAGYTATGEAMGMQLVAPVGRNADCFALAYAHEAAAGPGITRRPPPLLT
jgi:amidase